MKLSKARLIKLVKNQLNSLGYAEFKDSSTGFQGLFSKRLDNGLYLTLGLFIHRYYDNAFSAEFYLSKTTRMASIWDDIPKKSSARPSVLLTEEERCIYPVDEINVKGSYDIWWDISDEKAVPDFLRVIELTEPRFVNQPELVKEIENSKEVRLMAAYAQMVIDAVAKEQLQGSFRFLPVKEIDDIPLAWFKAAEKVLKDMNGILNASTVKLLAADAYRQKRLEND